MIMVRKTGTIAPDKATPDTVMPDKATDAAGADVSSTTPIARIGDYVLA